MRARDSLPVVDSTVGVEQAGTIAVVVPGSESGPRRVVLVSRVHEATKTATIHLATNVVEAATDFDLIVHPDESGVPVVLVLESELYGPVFVEQLVEAIGRIPDEHLAAFSESLRSDGESLDGYRVGFPLGDEQDPRRLFKRDELDALRVLVGECRTFLAGDPGPNGIFDPALLLPPPDGASQVEAEDRFLELLDAAEAAGQGSLDIPADLLALLDESGILDEMARWGDFGFDAWRVLSKVTVGDPGAETAPPTTERVSLQAGEEPQAEAVLIPFIRAQAGKGAHVLAVHTSVRCARYPQDRLVVTNERGQTCRGRTYLIEKAA